MRASAPPLSRARRAKPAAFVRARPLRRTQIAEHVASTHVVDAFAPAQRRSAALSPDSAAVRAELAFRTALDETAALARMGIQPVWVFDLDNTLYDTRARTLAIGKAFDLANGTSYFAGIETADMARIQRDGAQTASALQMSPAHATAFATYWAREFWLPENVRFDVEIPEMFDRLMRVIEAGGVPMFLTGRAEEWLDEVDKTTRRSFRAPTLARLRRSWQEHARRPAWDITDAALVLKPSPARNTRAFKAGVVEREQGVPVRASRRIAMRQKQHHLPQQQARVLVATVTDTLAELTEFGRGHNLRAFWVRTSPEAHLTGERPGWVHALAPVF